MIGLGFIGCEAFDIILYLARTLTKLNYKILIIDLSDTDALSNSIKHGMNLDSRKEIICYRNLHYTRSIPPDNELEAFGDGVALISFSYNFHFSIPILCNRINIVVNPFPHVIEKINQILQQINKEHLFHLLIRDVISPDDIDRVRETITSSVPYTQVSSINHDSYDYENAIQCEVSKVIRFRRCSIKMSKFIIDQIHDMFPYLKLSKIKRALKKAKRGER